MGATWKQAERMIARALGGVRNVGNGRGDLPDVDAPGLAVEVKHRRAFPAWLLGAMAQARRNARGRVPVVALHQHGGRYEDSLIVVRLGDFDRLQCLHDGEGEQ